MKDLTYGDALKIAPTQPVYDGTTQLPVSRNYRVDSTRFLKSFSWVYVVSSNVSAIAYDIKSKRLYVMFKSGDVYLYGEVDSSTARDMFNCSSMGQFVHRRLKGKYPFRKTVGREQHWPGLGITVEKEDH